MMYQLTHTTTYDYVEPVSLSHHVLRLRPRELPYQNCLAHAFAIEPSPKRYTAHTDCFGNRASFVEVEELHTKLVIRSSSKVRRKAITKPNALETPAWEQIRDLSRGIQLGAALEASEFLFNSPLISTADEFADYAILSFSKGRPILDAVLHLTQRIHEDFTFDLDATAVTTSVNTVMKTRRGVCQDFAHLQIACLRSLGLPARYVSGYIEKPTYDYTVSMSVYVFEPRVMNYIPFNMYLDFPDLVLKLIAAGEKVSAYRFDGYWMDIGRPDDYDEANRNFASLRPVLLPGSAAAGR